MEYNEDEEKKIINSLETEDDQEVKKQRNKGNKKRKILKVAIFLVLILIVMKLFLSLFGNHNNYEKNSYYNTSGFSTNQFVQGEYLIIDNYNLYKETKANIASQCKNNSSLNLSKFSRLFFLNNNLLAVICDGHNSLESKIKSFSKKGNNINITMYIDTTGGITADNYLHLYFIPISKSIEKVNVNYEYESYNDSPSIDKPIIYLYPTKETEISVKLLKTDDLTCSYPKYKNEWNVLAQTNGNLKDLTTNRQLYSLYYECKSEENFNIESDGFIVKSEDTVKFLEEKLSILGLTEREAEEFIIYWLPKLEANKYNYIRFATLDEINNTMPIEISPKPDTTIRILMTFKGLDNPITVQEQQLEKVDRTGFVAVEWGGTEIK